MLLVFCCDATLNSSQVQDVEIDFSSKAWLKVKLHSAVPVQLNKPESYNGSINRMTLSWFHSTPRVP